LYSSYIRERAATEFKEKYENDMAGVGGEYRRRTDALECDRRIDFYEIETSYQLL